jgi:hypothetical protein
LWKKSIANVFMNSWMNYVREFNVTNDLSEDKESVTMTGLHEHQVKRRVGREDSFSGSQRGILNQHRTGVVSDSTPRDILKRRPEPLWAEEFDVHW